MADCGQREALETVGCLLDRAIDFADAKGETLLAAHIEQAIVCLDERCASLGIVRERTHGDG